MLLILNMLCVPAVWGQSNRGGPHIGYVYPAGGQRGSTFEVVVGGQNLRGAEGAYVSGKGVRARVVKYYRPLNNLMKEQRDAITRRLRELIAKQIAEAPGQLQDLPSEVREFIRVRGDGARRGATDAGAATQPAELPEHPLLRNLERKSLRELLHVRNELLVLKRRQPNPQLAESVVIEVTIEKNAPAGDREIRVKTSQGLTNPLVFVVGLLPETFECEPNDPRSGMASLLNDAPLELPVLINGQVKPGDVDRFRFRARGGRPLAIQVQARHLIPYLADAVPGWFQATVALYDAEGREVAFADDYRFDPDPVLLCKVPKDGEYQIEIRDALYRGRDDFVYRLAVGEQSAIARAVPWEGLKPVTTAPAALGGHDEWWPRADEVEPNDALEKSQIVELPRQINGRIHKPSDVDVFQFDGRAGEVVVAEVYARRLYSPLDSLLRLTDATGRVLAWNDDFEDKESGLLTHHADSYLRAQLPADGRYAVSLSDSQRQGGFAYQYWLRIGPPRPDFALRVTPSSVNIRTGSAEAVCVHVVRKDGFDGEIDVVLTEAPRGFRLSGGRIPAGRDQVWMTLSAPREPLREPAVLRLEGIARISGETLRRPVVPAEDMMQAFAYRHLTPSRELLVATVGPSRSLGPVELVSHEPVRVPAGGRASIRIRTPNRLRLEDVTLELRDPPEGLTLGPVTRRPEGASIEVKADGGKVKVGLADNLVIEAFGQSSSRRAGGSGSRASQRFSMGVLPAIPFEIVPGSGAGG